MESLPAEVGMLQAFLARVGLSQTRSMKSGSFDNRLIEYASADVTVQIVCDRSVWHVLIGDAPLDADAPYDVAVLRDLIVGPGEDVLSLMEQTQFVLTKWTAIVERFGVARRKETHARLSELRHARMPRLFPKLRR